MNDDSYKSSFEITPYRFIPVDLGHNLDKKIIDKIKKSLYESNNWEIIAEENESTKELVFKLKAKKLNEKLYFDIYSDGIGVFTYIDDKEFVNDYQNYNVYETLSKKQKSHENILLHKHPISKIIKETLNLIKPVFKQKSRRFSSYDDWEMGGLSYIMSTYFIDCSYELFDKNPFLSNIIFLLYPYYDEYFPQSYSKITFIEKQYIDYLFKEKKNTLNEYREVFPNYHVFSSWSIILIVGKISDPIIERYHNMERDFQHVWFYTYITNKYIENALSSINNYTNRKSLNNIDEITTGMILKVNKYTSILKSSTSEKRLRINKLLVKTSKLDLQIKCIEENSDILKNRLSWLIDEKRQKTNKKIEYLLLFIALISLLDIYDKIVEMDLKYLALIIIAIFVICSVMYIPFIKIR